MVVKDRRVWVTGRVSGVRRVRERQDLLRWMRVIQQTAGDDDGARVCHALIGSEQTGLVGAHEKRPRQGREQVVVVVVIVTITTAAAVVASTTTAVVDKGSEVGDVHQLRSLLR